MRLIDADKLMKTIRENDYLVVDYFNSIGRGMFTSGIQQAIDELPSARLERKKGKWIPKDDRRYHCSSCDGIAPKGYRWDFCPNCGADMRGEEE